jgi:hypothetical protein
VAIDAEYVYWVISPNVAKWNKASAERILISLEGQEEGINALTADDTRLYLATYGCAKIISMSKSGGEMTVSENPVTGDNVCGITTLTTDATHVYCSGGGCPPTMGKVFRCPKEGGEVTEVTTVPEVDLSPSTAAQGPQVTGMAVVEDKLYFITNFHDDVLAQYLGWAPAAGGEYTRIAELRGVHRTKRLHHDIEQNALYFLASGGLTSTGIFKYDLGTGQLLFQRTPSTASTPMAMDDEYFYWSIYNAELYRMKKF